MSVNTTKSKNYDTWLIVERGDRDYPAAITILYRDDLFQKVLAGEESADGNYAADLVKHEPTIAGIHAALVKNGFRGVHNIFTDTDGFSKNVVRIGRNSVAPSIQNVHKALKDFWNS